MAEPTTEALETARLLLASGPFLPRKATDAQLSLLATGYRLAFPNEDALNLGCPGCVARGYTKLEYWYNKNAPTDAAPVAQQEPTQPITMASQNQRYQLRDPNTEYRPFGSPNAYNRHNLTDEAVDAILKADPAARKLFVDNQDGATIPEPPAPAGGTTLTPGTAAAESVQAAQNRLAGIADTELADTNAKVQALRQVMAAVNGQQPSAYQHTELAIAKLELQTLQLALGLPTTEAPTEPTTPMQASLGGAPGEPGAPDPNKPAQPDGNQFGLGDPNAKAPQVGSLTDAGSGVLGAPGAVGGASAPTTGVGTSTLPEFKGTDVQTNTAASAAQNAAAGTAATGTTTVRPPSPSALRGMPKAELLAQYEAELGAKPDETQLTTNQQLVDAIIGYREHQASL